MVFAFEVIAKLPFFSTRINHMKRGFRYPLKEGGGREARGEKREGNSPSLEFLVGIRG
jgi:hypothetical protein